MRRIFNKQASPPEDPSVLAGEIEVVQAVRARSAGGNDILFGTPTRCPNCGDYGMIDEVDAARGRCELHCPGCLAEWVITRRALRAAGPLEGAAAPSPPAAVVSGRPAPPSGRPDPPSAGRLDAPPSAGRPDAPKSAPPPPDPAPDLPPVVVRAPDPDLRLLLIEDDPADAALLRTLLAPYASEHVRVVHVKTRADAERVVAERGSFDVVLMDLGLPDSTGINTLTEWRATGDTAPVVVLSGNDLPDLDQVTRKMGAAAFVHKRDLLDMVADSGRGADRLVGTLRAVAAPKR